MTERDIRGLFASLPQAETSEEQTALRLGEEAFVLLNRIAEALESIALSVIPGPKP